MNPNNNNNLSPLPFYTDTKFQDWRKPFSFGVVYPLYYPCNYIMPFQITREHRDNPIQSVNMYKKDGTWYKAISTQMVDSGLGIKSYADYGYDIILYTGNYPMDISQSEGQYYIAITDGVETWYSEVFTSVADISSYLRVEWWDAEDFFTDGGIVCYSWQNYKNRVFLDAELGKPEYTFEEDGEKRGGYFFPNSQVSAKTYKTHFQASEYFLDCLRLMRMADNVRIQDYFGNEYWANSLLITPKWTTQSNIAAVDMEFDTNTIAKKNGRGMFVGGDFNHDFNDDFMIDAEE